MMPKLRLLFKFTLISSENQLIDTIYTTALVEIPDDSSAFKPWYGKGRPEVIGGEWLAEQAAEVLK